MKDSFWFPFGLSYFSPRLFSILSLMMSMQNKFRNIDYRWAVYLSAAAILLFYVLSLTGCISTSAGIPNIFLISIQDQVDTNLQIHIGYFGICMKAGGQFYCMSTVGKDATAVFNDLSKTGTSHSKELGHLISVALVAQSKIFPFLLAGAGVVFFLGLASLLMLKRSIKKPSPKKPSTPKLLRTVTIFSVATSIGLALAAAVATEQTANALAFATTSIFVGQSSIRISAGVALQVLQWLIVGFSVLVELSIWTMFSINGKLDAAELLPYHSKGQSNSSGPGFGPPSPSPFGAPPPPGSPFGRNSFDAVAPQ
ncbi:Ca2+ regulator and membrane fusion protein Fig1-domain-containing protein [Astrocystis sublimbata]|nr:Ca2+ regulator and membrane fusion protein Fig1-domain-containing protein [Astrocystis sublimbata]